MKKKICLILVILIILLTVMVYKKRDKTFIIDDTLFAVSLNGTIVDKFPTRANYHIDITCKNAEGVWDVDNWQLELKNITGDVKCNLDFITANENYHINSLVKQSIEDQADKIINNEYRYVGYNPNNYVWFNNELWRIIGSISTIKSNGTTSYLVKIIRNESLNVINFDYKDWVSNTLGVFEKNTDYYNNWGSNTLSIALNNYYYGKKDATQAKIGGSLSSDICRLYHSPESTYGKCDYRNNGIDPNGTYGKMIEEVLWNIGAITDSNMNTQNFKCNNESGKNIKGKIGLASCNDYNYIHRANDTANYVNWMSIKGVQYLISPRNTEEVLYITPNGTFGSTKVDNPMNVFPALYLKENVYVVSGNGTINNPYKIAM